VRRLTAKGRELQSDDVGEVASFAARECARNYKRPVFVEDTGLFVDALRGFPGPYASFAFSTLGTAGLLRLLEGVEDRRASFRSAIAYYEPAKGVRLFLGSVRGTMSCRAEGNSGFGFDPIFVPDGGKLTLAQMTLEQKCGVSHRGEAARRFGLWFRRGS